MNTTELILGAIVILLSIAGLVARSIRKSEKSRHDIEDYDQHNSKYNNYHLGEMTHYDIPKNKFVQRSGNMRWTNRNENEKKGKNKNEHKKSDK